MTPEEQLALARHNLAVAEAHPATTVHERRQKADNVAQIKAYIARLEHPSGGAA